MGDVSVTLLGGFDAAVGGVPVASRAWRLRKARELVKLLALAPGHRLHREQVLDALWRDFGPTPALNNLHQAVYIARRALGSDAILTEDELLRLVADVDVESFERAARDARRTQAAAAYETALSLYRGELLPENRYDDWASQRRDELAELAAQLDAELGELGGPPARRAGRLPADTSSFVGRARELAELRALIGRSRLLTLAGPGGGGKTRLALELARELEASFADGAALVELASTVDPADVADAIADAVDVRTLPGQEPLATLAEFLAQQSLLLVIDNCEHVLGEAARIAETLLRSAPGLTILSTSREPLRTPGEVVFRVPSLEIPDPATTVEPEALLRYDAVRLFVDRAAAALPGFRLDSGNALDVARICFRLDGLPLALELAAARLGALGPAEIAERLDDRFRLLRAGSRASPTRRQTLGATLDWSHELLEPDEKTLFRQLGVFIGGFELRAVEEVCGGEDLDSHALADLLARLVDKSLVTSDEHSSRTRRYHLLETVRLYARERLDAVGEAADLEERHARWALALAAANRFSPRLDREVANLRAAIDTLRARSPDDALRFCVQLAPFWLRRIELDEARRRFDDALGASPGRTAQRAEALLAAAAIDLRSGAITRGTGRAEQSYVVASEVGDRRGEWRALQALAEFGLATDEADVASPWLERALALAQQEGSAALEAVSIYSLGVVEWIRRDTDRAEELLGAAAERFRALADSNETIPSLVNLEDFRPSELAAWSGHRVVFEETLQPFTEISCAAAVGYVLANTAGIVRSRGDLDGARALLLESASRFELLADSTGGASVLVRIAYLELAEGDTDRARAALDEALAIRCEQNDRRGRGLALSGLALVETLAEDWNRAERYLAEARELFRRAGDRWGLATTLWRTADLAFARDRLDDAEAALEEARTVLEVTHRERWIANTLTGLAEVARRRGNVERASVLLADARARYASRADALGVADVDERARALLSAR